MALLAYRNLAREKKNIFNPNMYISTTFIIRVLPESAHPAFLKGAAYFNIEVKRVPISRKTF